MLELAITVAMIVGSIALFLYWFRYATIQSLLESATAAQADLQDHMVRIYYHAVKIWYATSRTLSTTAARHALDEMTGIIAHFANAAGQAAAA